MPRRMGKKASNNKDKVVSVRLRAPLLQGIREAIKASGSVEDVSTWIGNAAQMRLQAETPEAVRVRQVLECMDSHGVTLDMLPKTR
jgi:hypothetical protein